MAVEETAEQLLKYGSKGDLIRRIVVAFQATRDEALEEAVRICWVASDELVDRDDMTSEQGMAQHCAAAIRARIGKS